MFDLVVLGGGPAGMMAALRAHELGASVGLVEKGQLGGAAVTDGVVATRVLAQAARLVRDAARAQEYGLALPASPAVDFVRLRQKLLAVTASLRERKARNLLTPRERLTLFTGVGSTRFLDPHTIQLESGGTVQGHRIVICTGGAPRRAVFPGHEYTLTHREVLKLDRVPASLAIVGAGATGCHLASVFSAFGSHVTLLESQPRILPTEDEAVSATMAEAFIQAGIALVTGLRSIERVEPDGGGFSLVYRLDGGMHTLPASAVVLAIGWPGSAAGLGLDAIGVRTVGGNFVETNDYLQTSVAHIYAAGDITGRMPLVHSAAHQGMIAAENALRGSQRTVENRLVPRGTFTEPEYAGVGLTEAQVSERFDALTVTVSYADLDRAVIDGRTAGFCKLIVNRKNELVLGAHIVGEQARELISVVAAGMAAEGGLSVTRLIELEREYPSYTALLGMAARQAARALVQNGLEPDWQSLSDWFKRLPE